MVYVTIQPTDNTDQLKQTNRRSKKWRDRKENWKRKYIRHFFYGVGKKSDKSKLPFSNRLFTRK